MEASCFMQKFNHKISIFYISSNEINIFATRFTMGCSLIRGGNSREEEEEEAHGCCFHSQLS